MYAKEDVFSNSRVKLDQPVPTRQVRSKIDGTIVTIDDRQFDPEMYEELEPAGDQKPVA